MSRQSDPRPRPKPLEFTLPPSSPADGAGGDWSPEVLIELWVGRYGPAVAATCRYHGFGGQDVDDLSQNVFERALEALRGGTVVRNPRAWLGRVAYSACKTEQRRRIVEVRFNQPLTNAQEVPCSRETPAWWPELEELINRLSLRDRTVILLWLRKESWTELAAELGLSISKARRLVASVIDKLKRMAKDDRET